jgi:hypothetical protein
MKKTELQTLRDRIIEAMNISAKMFIEDKIRKGHKIVISENKVIKVIDPKDVQPI